MSLKSLKRQCWFLVVLTILLGGVLAQKSFAACYDSGRRIGVIFSDGCHYGLACTSTTCSDIANACSAVNCSSVVEYSGKYYTNVRNSNSTTDWCNNSSNSNCGSVGLTSYCQYMTYCDTQSEADSLNCALNPDADGCVSCDTITETRCANRYIIRELGQGGYWAATDVTLTYEKCSDGSVAILSEQYGYELPNVSCEEIADTTSVGSDSIRCVGTIGPQCIIQVGPNQSFLCPCDEGCDRLSSTCDDILDSLFASSSSAQNSSSSAQSSSSSDGEGSSGSAGGSSGSEGGEGSSGSAGGTSSGIDYSGQLKKIQDTLDLIRDNTGMTAGFAQSIDNKMNMVINTAENGTQVITDKLGNITETIVDEVHEGWTTLNTGIENLGDIIQDTATGVPSVSDDDISEMDSTVETFEPDTSDLLDSSLVNADSLRDKLFEGIDTLYNDSMLSLLDSLEDVLDEPDFDSLKNELDNLNNALDDTIEKELDDAVDTLLEHYYSPMDSVLDVAFAGLQNTEECPESCWKFNTDVPFTFGTFNVDFDFSDYLCGSVPISFLSNHGVLYFLKIVLRLVASFFACMIIASYMKDVLK